jgi:hypothetical protein
LNLANSNPYPHSNYYNKNKIGKNTKIELICDFCEGPISGDNDFFAVFSVEPLIRKSIGEGLNHLREDMKKKELQL